MCTRPQGVHASGGERMADAALATRWGTQSWACRPSATPVARGPAAQTTVTAATRPHTAAATHASTTGVSGQTQLLSLMGREKPQLCVHLSRLQSKWSGPSYSYW